MNSKVKYFFYSLCIFFISCANKKTDTNAAKQNEAAAALTGPEIPGISQDAYQRLLDSCTYIDYIFHDLPFSMSQNEKADLSQNVMFIDTKRPVGQLNPACKPAARKFFSIKGVIVYDVDVYISPACSYYVFVDKAGKPLFANQMTESGRNFYNNILKQVSGATSQGGQQ